MATPNPWPGALSDANLGKLAHTGDKTGVKIIYARIRYTGSAWEVSGSTDSNEIVSANCVWSTNKLTIAISGFTIAPGGINATQHVSATVPYMLQVGSTSATNIDVEFWDTAGAQVTTQATSMDFYITITGS